MSVEAWAISTPDGYLATCFIADTERGALEMLADFACLFPPEIVEKRIEIFQKEGYRAVKVRITEVEGE